MSDYRFSRRYFFYGSLLAGAVPQAGYGSVPSLRALGYKPFYNRLNIASIGCGGQGGAILNQAAATVANDWVLVDMFARVATGESSVEDSVRTAVRAAARVGRSSLATTSGQAYGGARVFRRRTGMLAAGRPPGRRRPCWGDGTSGGGWADWLLGRSLPRPAEVARAPIPRTPRCRTGFRRFGRPSCLPTPSTPAPQGPSRCPRRCLLKAR